MQISYRTYNSYHLSSISLSQHNQTEQRKMHNAISEVSKGDCIIMGGGGLTMGILNGIHYRAQV